MQTKLPGIESEAKSQPIIQTYLKVQKAFPTEADYAMVVVKADDVNAPAVQAAIAKLNPADVDDQPAAHGRHVNVAPRRQRRRRRGDGGHASTCARPRIPAAFGKLGGGVTADVTGEAAATADFSQMMKTKTPIVFAFVLGLSFLLLLFTFRSIVIPIKAIMLNLLSVGASYGLLKLVFQDGHGEKLLGFESNGAITSWLPLFLFVILFGLSMDYHVFILSRIREACKSGMSTEKAVAHGIKTTAGTITSAAIIMVVVFADFATQSSLDMKQMGVGLAFAIFVDATIIRGVLLPATMKLLGDWNWYLPRWLQWIPELDHEGGSTQAAQPRRAAPRAVRRVVQPTKRTKRPALNGGPFVCNQPVCAAYLHQHAQRQDHAPRLPAPDRRLARRGDGRPQRAGQALPHDPRADRRGQLRLRPAPLESGVTRGIILAVLSSREDWIWDSWIADDGERYHLFFLKAPRALRDPRLRHERARIGHATSLDLVDWDVHEDALGPASEGFDDLALWTGSVARGDDGVWRMYYTALNSEGRGERDQRIGMAESDDLMTWRRAAHEPLIAPDPRSTGCSTTAPAPARRGATRSCSATATAAGTCTSPPATRRASGGRTAWSRTRAATTWSTGGSLRR